MDPIGYLGIFVALAGLAGGIWSATGHIRAGARPKAIGSAIVCALVAAAGVAIVVLALRGGSSAGTEGRWHARFEIDGTVYEGVLEVHRDAGPLTVTYRTAQGRSRAVEQCTLRREGQRVTIGCRDAKLIEGQGTYSPDNFDLTFANARTLQGSITSQNGASTGSAMFVRR